MESPTNIRVYEGWLGIVGGIYWSIGRKILRGITGIGSGGVGVGEETGVIVFFGLERTVTRVKEIILKISSDIKSLLFTKILYAEMPVYVIINTSYERIRVY